MSPRSRTVTHLTPMLLPRRPKKDDERGLVLAAAALQDHISRSYKLSHPLPSHKAPVATCSRCGRLPSNEKRTTRPTLSDGLPTGKCKYKICGPCSMCCIDCNVAIYCCIDSPTLVFCAKCVCVCVRTSMCMVRLSVCTCSKKVKE